MAQAVRRERFSAFALTFAWVAVSFAIDVVRHVQRFDSVGGYVLKGVLAVAWLALGLALYRRARRVFERWRFLLGAWLVTLAVLYGAVVAMYFFKQDWLIFPPVIGQFDRCFSLGEEDQKPDFSALDTKIDGEHVRAFLKEQPGARAWMLMFHGNAESACSAIFYARVLSDLPLNFAIVEYPGYGGDDHAHASQEAFQKNSLAAFDAIEGRGRLPIFVYGRSIGTGVATYVAAMRPVSGTVLISPYTSIVDVGSHLFPYLPVAWVLRNPFPAADWAASVHTPVLLLHGTADRTIPIAIGKAEAEHFGAYGHWIEYPGLGHGTIVAANSPAWQAIRGFVRVRLSERR